MKILMTMFQIQDYGGIVNHAEHLAAGLKNLGCEVDFNILIPSHKVVTRNEDKIKNIEDFRTYGTGYKFHQRKGWVGVPKIPYLNYGSRKRFIDSCKQYDAVLWQIPVPTKAAENKGKSEWLDLYDNGTKNIAIIHDGNIEKLYPHLAVVLDHFWSLVCVHEAAYNSSACMPKQRKMIVNPINSDHTGIVSLPRLPAPDFSDKGQGIKDNWKYRSGFSSIQIFKGWKKVHTLVKAIPHMKNQEYKHVGGTGIEYHYMTSIDKCKPAYLEEDGTRIWDNALNSGMTYLGLVTPENVLRSFATKKLQIDPSWSKSYSGYGAHFNRTTVEAIISGAVPMATDLGMINSKYFKSGENYIEIPHTATPQEFAEIVDESLNNFELWKTIRENNVPFIKMFDKTNVAQQYLDLITDRSGCEKSTHFSDKVAKGCLKNLEFFEVNVNPALLSKLLWPPTKTITEAKQLF
jgi:glycosyltransferase involved in cell wall biosynthesis